MAFPKFACPSSDSSLVTSHIREDLIRQHRTDAKFGISSATADGDVRRYGFIVGRIQYAVSE